MKQNCLPRCASLFMYGIEDHHSEIRRKIATELEENSEYYLDDKSFEKGRNPNGRRAATSVFASFSDHYFAEKLNTNGIRNIFVLEVNEKLNLKRGWECGKFHVFQTSFIAPWCQYVFPMEQIM